MAIMYVNRTRKIKRVAWIRSIHCAMHHMCLDLQRSRAMEVRLAAPGFTAAFIQNPAITAQPRASLMATRSFSGAFPGQPTGVFFIIAHRLTRRVVRGQNARNMYGGMRNSKNGAA